MKNLPTIRKELGEGAVTLTQHALRRMGERNISAEEIRQAGCVCEVIEEYPADKYSPSVLLLGFTSDGRPLHFQVSLTGTDSTTIITMYEPDPALWIDFRKRR